MSDVYKIATEFRRALLDQDGAASLRMMKAWREAGGRIQRQLDALHLKMRAERQAGHDISAAWLAQNKDLQALMREIRQEIFRLARNTSEETEQRQRLAYTDGLDHQQRLIRERLGRPPEDAAAAGVGVSFHRPNTAAVENLVGYLGDGTPLSKLLEAYGEEAAEEIRKHLVSGLVAGLNPNQIGRQMRDAMGGNLVRAMTVARTETMRAYRQAATDTYKANSDVVKGWRWTASRSSRTCAVCLAMDGTEHGVDEVMGTHPNCRCTQVPITKTWEEMGFTGVPEAAKPPETGADWFERQNLHTKAKILRPAKLAAYLDGKVKLTDLIGHRVDPEWGPVRWEKSLTETLGIDGAHPYINQARDPKTRIDPDREDLLKDITAINGEVGKLTGLSSRWSGDVEITHDPSFFGVKRWNCSIGIERDILQVPKRYSTSIHEVIHAHSVGLVPLSYRKFRGFEEGVVEKTMRLLRPEVTAAMGVKVDAATWAQIDGRNAYNGYIADLEKLRRFTGKGEREFYLELLGTDLKKREGVIEAWALAGRTGPDEIRTRIRVHAIFGRLK